MPVDSSRLPSLLQISSSSSANGSRRLSSSSLSSNEPGGSSLGGGRSSTEGGEGSPGSSVFSSTSSTRPSPFPSPLTSSQPWTGDSGMAAADSTSSSNGGSSRRGSAPASTSPTTTSFTDLGRASGTNPSKSTNATSEPELEGSGTGTGTRTGTGTADSTGGGGGNGNGIAVVQEEDEWPEMSFPMTSSTRPSKPRPKSFHQGISTSPGTSPVLGSSSKPVRSNSPSPSNSPIVAGLAPFASSSGGVGPGGVGVGVSAGAAGGNLKRTSFNETLLPVPSLTTSSSHRPTVSASSSSDVRVSMVGHGHGHSNSSANASSSASHNRHLSLTSACLPATATYVPASASSSHGLGLGTGTSSGFYENDSVSPTSSSPGSSLPFNVNVQGGTRKSFAASRNSSSPPKNGGKNGNGGGGLSYPPSPILGGAGGAKARGWRVFKWMPDNGDGQRRDSSSPSEADGVSHGPDSPRLIKSKPNPLPPPGYRPPSSFLLLLAALLGPFGPILISSIHPHYYHHAYQHDHPHYVVGGKSKRTPLLFRILGAAYVIFSLCFLSARLVGIVNPGQGGLLGGGYSNFGLERRALDDLGSSASVAGAGAGRQLVVGLVEEEGGESEAERGAGLRKIASSWADRFTNGLMVGVDSIRSGVGKHKGFGGHVGGHGHAVGKHGFGSDAVVSGAVYAEDGVRRKWMDSHSSLNPAVNPLTPFSHSYRFSKMHSKVHWNQHDGIEPYAFAAENPDGRGEVTACIYTNNAWVSQLPEFVKRWNGPVSLVYETMHSRTSPHRETLLSNIARLRSSEPLVRQLVDFHIVSTLPASRLASNRTRERLITRPVATNFQLNLARFFSRTDMVWLVGDARVLPNSDLRKKLNTETTKNLVLKDGDAIVVPTFGFLRSTPEAIPDFSDPSVDTLATGSSDMPTLDEIRSGLSLPTDGRGRGAGVSSKEFTRLASEYVSWHRKSLPVSMDWWPTRKSALMDLASSDLSSVTIPGSSKPIQTPVVALHDLSWGVNRGPTNFPLWRKMNGDPRLQEESETGGGLGLGLKGAVGGGNQLYRVTDYDLHYAPNVVVSKQGQPWCTERFDNNKAACVYQMYLAGSELWVLPDEWAYTLEIMEKPRDSEVDEAQKLKSAIETRLYSKFHQEACMHYGREFLSMDLWDSHRAKHLRLTCARVLSSYGMGVVLN